MTTEYESDKAFKLAYENLKGRLENLLKTPGESIIDIEKQLQLLLLEFNNLWATQSYRMQEHILKKDKRLMTELTHLTVLILKKIKERKETTLMSHLSPTMQKILSQIDTYKV